MGRYGQTMRIYEPRLGAALRWDYRDEDGRHRPEVMPTLRVRRSPDAAVDPAKERVARDLCEKRAAQASLTDLRAQTEPERLTLGQAFRLFHEPRRRALPPSPQARKHHTDSRAFWEAELGPDTPWAGLRPADVRAALIRLKETGKVQTAAKRLQNLGRIARWLVEDMGYDELRDPTRGVKSSQLLEGYEPKRRRYTPEQIRRLREALTEGDPRFRLFLSILMDSGTRSVQARTLMRSAVNATLEPPPPAGWGPHGWIVLPGVKSQPPLPWPMTSRVRARVDEALAGYLAEWEAEWQDAGEDYPLIPGRYSGEHGHLVKVPAGTTAAAAPARARGAGRGALSAQPRVPRDPPRVGRPDDGGGGPRHGAAGRRMDTPRDRTGALPEPRAIRLPGPRAKAHGGSRR